MANDRFRFNSAPFMFQLNNQQLNEQELRNPHQVAKTFFNMGMGMAIGVFGESVLSYNFMQTAGQTVPQNWWQKFVGFPTSSTQLTPQNLEKLGQLAEYMPSAYSTTLQSNPLMFDQDTGKDIINWYVNHPELDRNFGIWKISGEAINQQSIWQYELGRGVVEQLGPDQIKRLGLNRNINLMSKSVQEELKQYQIKKGYEPQQGYKRLSKLFGWDKQNRIAQTYQDFQVEQAKQAGKIVDDQQQAELKSQMTKMLTNQIGQHTITSVLTTGWQAWNISQTITGIAMGVYGVQQISQQQYESRELKRKYRVIGQMGNYAVVNDKSIWYSKAEQQIMQYSLQHAYDLKARVSDTLVMSNPYKQMYQSY